MDLTFRDSINIGLKKAKKNTNNNLQMINKKNKNNKIKIIFKNYQINQNKIFKNLLKKKSNNDINK